jgi:quercetin dioxygenase-like cupin family protein
MMAGRFVLASDARTEELDWGTLRWICSPDVTGAVAITTTQVWLKAGLGHDFHRHPDQEELITVLEGEVEQWLETERRVLRPGDSIFIPAGVVHASFNCGDGRARMHVVLGPCVGPTGYEVEDVASEDPWRSLRR